MAIFERKVVIPQILLLLICVVIFNYTAKVEQPQPLAEAEAEASGTMTEEARSDGGDVKEIFGVKIQRNPPQSKLDQLAVTSWPTWEGKPCRIPWTFSAKETMYLLEGKVKVYCDGHDEFFEIGGGDLVEFPKGMKITWHVIEAVKKHYNLDK